MSRMQFNLFILTTYEILVMNHSVTVAEINNFLLACIYHLFIIRPIETNVRMFKSFEG